MSNATPAARNPQHACKIPEPGGAGQMMLGQSPGDLRDTNGQLRMRLETRIAADAFGGDSDEYQGDALRSCGTPAGFR